MSPVGVFPISKRRRTQGDRLRRILGFDKTRFDRSTRMWRVRCSQCEALVINGTPCHEVGCPNKKGDD